MRRRSAARASRARVWAFSFTSSCLRASSHASDGTTAGVRMTGCPPFRPLSADVSWPLKPPGLGESPAPSGRNTLPFGAHCSPLIVRQFGTADRPVGVTSVAVSDGVVKAAARAPRTGAPLGALNRDGASLGSPSEFETARSALVETGVDLLKGSGEPPRRSGDNPRRRPKIKPGERIIIQRRCLPSFVAVRSSSQACRPR